jgi:hypothetical protein
MINDQLPSLYLYDNKLVVANICLYGENAYLECYFVDDEEHQMQRFNVDRAAKFKPVGYNDEERLKYLFVGATWKTTNNNHRDIERVYLNDTLTEVLVTVTSEIKNAAISLELFLKWYSPVTAD